MRCFDGPEQQRGDPPIPGVGRARFSTTGPHGLELSRKPLRGLVSSCSCHFGDELNVINPRKLHLVHPWATAFAQAIITACEGADDHPGTFAKIAMPLSPLLSTQATSTKWKGTGRMAWIRAQSAEGVVERMEARLRQMVAHGTPGAARRDQSQASPATKRAAYLSGTAAAPATAAAAEATGAAATAAAAPQPSAAMQQLLQSVATPAAATSAPRMPVFTEPISLHAAAGQGAPTAVSTAAAHTPGAWGTHAPFGAPMTRPGAIASAPGMVPAGVDQWALAAAIQRLGRRQYGGTEANLVERLSPSFHCRPWLSVVAVLVVVGSIPPGNFFFVVGKPAVLGCAVPCGSGFWWNRKTTVEDPITGRGWVPNAKSRVPGAGN